MEVAIIGVDIPACIKINSRPTAEPIGFPLHSNKIAIPKKVLYRQGDSLIISPVHLPFLLKSVKKFIGISIHAGDSKMLRHPFHIKIQTGQQRIKAAIADNAAFQADACQQFRWQDLLPLTDLRLWGPRPNFQCVFFQFCLG